MKETSHHHWNFRSGVYIFQCLLGAAAVAAVLLVGGCATTLESMKGFEGEQRPEYFERSATLFREGNYDAAFKENQRLLAEKKAAPDVALFNMGLIAAYSLNPKKDYPKALLSFRTLATQYPRSPLAEQAKVWIQVLEEHQKMVEERQKLVEEKRALTRERETLSQEREKLKYIAERSRRVDMEIEKRRRQSLNR
jgi:hypothetical protein